MPEELSKSARKREADRLQKLGRRLADLNSDQLDTVPVSTDLATAIADYRRFTSHGAQRRQAQFIGRLMRSEDIEAIIEALDRIDGDSAQVRFEHHQTERWRDRLLEDDVVLTEFLSQYPNTDRQALRALIRSARRHQGDKAHNRALFRFLRDAAKVADPR
jgi:ribosome-associated protein